MRGGILITGAAGFIGSHLVDALLKKGYKVIGVDNLSMGKMENIEHNLTNPLFSFYKGDVRDLDFLRSISKGITVIVHLAAYKIPRYGNSLQTLEVNNKGAWNAFEIAKENKGKVVIASTSDVYGKNPNFPFSEKSDLIVGPSDIIRWSYAVSKLFDEHLAFAFQEAYGIKICILRYFASYGPRHHISWWGGPQGVFIDTILRGKEVEIHGDGKQTRSFTYISDTISGTVAAIENDKANGEIFNIGNTEEISILDLAYLIKELSKTKGDIKLKFIPYTSFSGGKYEDVKRRVPDITKARKILGFKPKIGLQEGLEMTIEWQKNLSK